MGVNSLPKTVTRQRRGCNLNPGPSAPESSMLTTRLPCWHVPINKVWRRTESAPRSGWRRSHVAGIYTDCSTREINNYHGSSSSKFCVDVVSVCSNVGCSDVIAISAVDKLTTVTCLRRDLTACVNWSVSRQGDVTSRLTVSCTHTQRHMRHSCLRYTSQPLLSWDTCVYDHNTRVSYTHTYRTELSDCY